MNYLAVLFGEPSGRAAWANVPVTLSPLDVNAVRVVEREVAQANGWPSAVLVNLIPLNGLGFDPGDEGKPL